jgi:tetrapyrrole methylase family protein/MazG family protein
MPDDHTTHNATSAAAAAEFARLVDIVARLRAPDGCPWDREQTIDSLKPFVLEETYEVLETIDHHDHTGLVEELGDFLFQAVFLAQLEHEAGLFSIVESVRSIADKLIRRHPHVFARESGEPPLHTPDDVRTRWEEIKKQERGGTSKPRTLLGGIPATLPALLRAYEIGIRAASVGFDWERAEDVAAKVQEEVDELRQVLFEAGPIDRERAEEEMGDLLFTLANLARQLGIEPETALRKANDKFTRRFETMEQSVSKSGHGLKDLRLEELEQQWQQAKAGNSGSS